MGSYDGAKLCKLTGIYLLSQLYTIISKKNCWLYRDDGLMIQEHIYCQQIDQLLKKIINVFKKTGFKIDIETKLKIANFLDLTFNLINGSQKLDKKPNDTLLYLNKNSTHPPQVIKKLQKTINDRLCRNPSDAEVFHASKTEYEAALKNSGYKNLAYKNNNKLNR